MLSSDANSDSEGARDSSDVRGEGGTTAVSVNGVSCFQICDGNRNVHAKVRAEFRQTFYMADESVNSVMGPSTVSFEFIFDDLEKDAVTVNLNE